MGLNADAARGKVLEACREYFSAAYPEGGPHARGFVAGETYIPVTVKVVDGDDLSSLVDASLDMWLTAGRFAREMESVLSRQFGRETQALLVNSGSSANLVAVSSLGARMLPELKLRPLEPGDEVITAAAGFPTTVNPIIQNGWKPVFVDVDFKTLNATPEKVMAARSPRTRAVMLAHSLGNAYRADEIAAWCEKEGLYLIEDCCDALGAKVGGASVGSFGEFATVSFYPAHHITMGEGGAVIPKNGRWKRIAESVRDWGRDCWCEPGKDNTCNKRFCWKLGGLPEGYDHKYIYSNIGYNLKVTDMQAALGVSQLKKLPGFIEARRRNWKTLHDGIMASPLLRDRFEPVLPTEGTTPSWFGFALHCQPGMDRNAVVRFLEESRIGTRLMFGGNLTQQPAYKPGDYRISGELTATDAIMHRTFWIGVHPALTPTMIRYMLERLEEAAKRF